MKNIFTVLFLVLLASLAAAQGPTGYVTPQAPVALDSNGNWQYLQVDDTGALLTSGEENFGTPSSSGLCFVSTGTSIGDWGWGTCPSSSGGNVSVSGTPTADNIATFVGGGTGIQDSNIQIGTGDSDVLQLNSSGKVPAGNLPNPTSSTLGGIESIVAATHEWIDSISTGGAPHQSQPACADLSDSGTACSATIANYATLASPAFTGTVTMPLTTAGIVTTTSGGAIGSEASATVAQGGTGTNTLTSHGVVIGQGTSAVNITAAGTAHAPLLSGGASADPTYSAILYPTSATQYGFTYFSSTTQMATSAAPTAHGVIIGEAGAPTSTAAGTSGQPLLSGGASADPAYGTLGAKYGGTALDTSSSTGVPLVTAGTWSAIGYTAHDLIGDSGSAYGKVALDGTLGLTAGTLAVTTATTSQLGAVKPDGTTITITGGVISSSAGSGTELVDSNGNQTIVSAAAASAVNQVTVTNAATGNAPSLSATGTDTNINLRLAGKGTGAVQTTAQFQSCVGGGCPSQLDMATNSGTPCSISATRSGICVPPTGSTNAGIPSVYVNGGTDYPIMTTNGGTFSGAIVAGAGFTDSTQSTGCAQYDSGGVLTSTGTNCGSGSGGGSYAVTAATTQAICASVTCTGGGAFTFTNNGGVGDTIAFEATSGGNGQQYVDDGIGWTLGMQILVQDQATAYQNGVYTVTTYNATGCAGVGHLCSYVLTRATWFDTAALMNATQSIFVQSGDAYQGVMCGNTTTVATIDVTGLTFVCGTSPKCAAIGTSASPSVVSCGAANTGAFSCATNASGATCTIHTTAVTGSSVINAWIVSDEGGEALPSITCNTAPTGVPAIIVATKTPSTGFTINLPTYSTNPICFDFRIN